MKSRNKSSFNTIKFSQDRLNVIKKAILCGALGCYALVINKKTLFFFIPENDRPVISFFNKKMPNLKQSLPHIPHLIGFHLSN
jgi:hypothetical protein